MRSRSELRAAVARARPDVVFHLAAQALVRAGFERPVETFTINTTGTAKVLEALRDHGDPRAIVVVTSDKCYRNDGSGRRFAEDDALGGDDPYAASKAAQEHVAAAYRGLGLPLATVRAGNVLGGGDTAAGRLVADVDARGGDGRAAAGPRARRPCGRGSTCSARSRATWRSPSGSRPTPRRRRRAGTSGPDERDEVPVGALVEALRQRWPGGLTVRAAPPGAARRRGARAAARLLPGPRASSAGRRAGTSRARSTRRSSGTSAAASGADMRAETLRQIAAYAADGTVSG